MEKISGFINIFRTDNILIGGPVYELKEKAEETGKCVKGYLTTISVNFEIPDEVIE